MSGKCRDNWGCAAFLLSCSRKAMTASLSRRIVRSRGSPVGAHCRFDSGAVNELRELLRAVAAYASRGMKALNDLSCAAMPVRSSCWNR
jgi:hypothetical protein